MGELAGVSWPAAYRKLFGQSLSRCPSSPFAPNIRHSFDSWDGSEWNGPAALRPNVLAAALANELARIAWTVLAQERGYEARVAAIEPCDRRIRRASLDHRYLHLLARCLLCAKLSQGNGRLRRECRHE